MTRAGLAALAAGIIAIVLGVWFHWTAFSLVGIGLVALVAVGLLSILRPSTLTITRQILPPRVPKGTPAIAFLSFANKGRTSGAIAANQPFGSVRVRTVIPRLRRGESGMRTYRLPTSARGIFDVGPVEVTRRDPLEMFRVSRKYGHTERIWVYPRLLPFRPLPTGITRYLEGPSSDTSPQGNITFHRLRDYVPGDDLRLVHWRSSARTGNLVVKHNVDTSQPYSVVLLDHRPGVYTEAAFESAIDVAASVLSVAGRNKAPVELRLSDRTVIGGPRVRDVTPMIDHLTGLAADPAGSLREQLVMLRRAQGGTSLVVVTGVLDLADLPYVAMLRRRFERLVVVSINEELTVPVSFPGIRIITAPDADSACASWNVPVRA